MLLSELSVSLPDLKLKRPIKGDCVLAENRGGKSSAFFDKLVGEVILVDAGGDCCRLRDDLEYSVSYLTVAVAIFFRGYYIDTVAQFVGSIDVHGSTSDILLVARCPF